MIVVLIAHCALCSVPELVAARDLAGAAALPFKDKLEWFKRRVRANSFKCIVDVNMLVRHVQMDELRVPWEDGHQDLIVSRESILNDSFNAVFTMKVVAVIMLLMALNFTMWVSQKSDLRQIWRVKFDGEPALDAGGVAREWFTLVSIALFNVDRALFKYTDVGRVTYQINPMR